MVCFIRASELNVGKQYIYYDYKNLEILGTYLENGDFEYQKPSSKSELCFLDLYELSAAEPAVLSNSIPYEEIEAYIKHINSQLEEACQMYAGAFFGRKLDEVAGPFGIVRADLNASPYAKIANYAKPPTDPKLLRLREMLKKI